MKQATTTRLVQIVLAWFLVIGIGGFNLLTQPERTASAATEQVNVELILDASGSMAEEIAPGETRIDAARSVLTEVIDSLPERDGINVGFRVYGHLGNNTEAGRAESCKASELRVPVDGVDKAALHAEVSTYRPVGWTPIALSLNQAARDFPAAAPGVRNAIVLVTDGLETCGGNVCTASRGLVRGPGDVVTHVIGFALSADEQENLQCIVDESGGMLLGAGNADELSQALFTVLEELEVVQQNGQLEIESIGGVFPQATITGATEADDSNPAPQPFSLTLTDTNLVELPAGSYTVSWPNPSGTVSQVTVQIEADQKTVIRGSILRFPQGSGQIYVLKDQAGLVIWNAPIEYGDAVWVLPGVYRLALDKITANAALLSLDVQTLPGSVTQIDVSITG